MNSGDNGIHQSCSISSNLLKSKSDPVIRKEGFISLKHSFLYTDLRQGIGGAERDRTADLLRARQALSQLSYSPVCLSSFCHSSLQRSLASVMTHRGSLLCSLKLRLDWQNLSGASAIASTFEAYQTEPYPQVTAYSENRSDQGIEWRRVACYASHSITLSWAILVGLGGLEPPTSPLSGVRSNHLSYRPIIA